MFKAWGRSSILERVGDQIVIVSDAADDVLSTAISLLSKCYQEANFLPIHMGLHFGSVLQSEGRFFGTAVNLAARIASQANAGEILCSEAFISNLAHKKEFAFIQFRILKFKNILHPITVASLTGVDTNPRNKIDPVCKMNVDDQTTHKAEHSGFNYYFCSEECMTIFKSNPEIFTTS